MGNAAPLAAEKALEKQWRPRQPKSYLIKNRKRIHFFKVKRNKDNFQINECWICCQETTRNAKRNSSGRRQLGKSVTWLASPWGLHTVTPFQRVQHGERARGPHLCGGRQSPPQTGDPGQHPQWQVMWGRPTFHEMKMALRLCGLPPNTRTPRSHLRQTSDESQLRNKLQNHAWKHASCFQGHQQQEESEKCSCPRGA